MSFSKNKWFKMWKVRAESDQQVSLAAAVDLPQLKRINQPQVLKACLLMGMTWVVCWKSSVVSVCLSVLGLFFFPIASQRATFCEVLSLMLHDRCVPDKTLLPRFVLGKGENGARSSPPSCRAYFEQIKRINWSQSFSATLPLTLALYPLTKLSPGCLVDNLVLIFWMGQTGSEGELKPLH